MLNKGEEGELSVYRGGLDRYNMEETETPEELLTRQQRREKKDLQGGTLFITVSFCVSSSLCLRRCLFITLGVSSTLCLHHCLNVSSSLCLHHSLFNTVCSSLSKCIPVSSSLSHHCVFITVSVSLPVSSSLSHRCVFITVSSSLFLCPCLHFCF